jgi:GNAT superfamily N-acetyltransferase
MTNHVRVEPCTHQDFLDILSALEDFWGDASERARRVHHPMFVHEFGDTAWIVREDGQIIAYLFGFWSQTEPTGYIHLVAVRRTHQGRSIGRWLYEQFEARARDRGCTKLRATTSPINSDSIAFHQHLGFVLLGGPNEKGIPVVADYFGPGVPRVVFEKQLR